MSDLALGTWLPTGSGLPWSVVCGIALVWVLRLPADAMLTDTLYFSFQSVV
jgi:hypothetical protein